MQPNQINACDLDDEDFDDEDENLDPWVSTDDYGYADATIIGTDTWEDQAGLAELKAYLKLPEEWFLVKVVNFGRAGRTLDEMMEWLAENCVHPYQRVGWSSSCSTKVGVAFENTNEAFFFKLRWR